MKKRDQAIPRRKDPADCLFSGDTSHLSPTSKRSVAKDAMMRCLEMMTANSEQILDLPVNRKEPLRLVDSLEPWHLPLLLAGMLM